MAAVEDNVPVADVLNAQGAPGGVVAGNQPESVETEDNEGVTPVVECKPHIILPTAAREAFVLNVADLPAPNDIAGWTDFYGAMGGGRILIGQKETNKEVVRPGVIECVRRAAKNNPNDPVVQGGYALITHQEMEYKGAQFDERINDATQELVDHCNSFTDFGFDQDDVDDHTAPYVAAYKVGTAILKEKAMRKMKRSYQTAFYQPEDAASDEE